MSAAEHSSQFDSHATHTAGLMVSSSLKPVPQVLTQSSFFKKKLVAHMVHIVLSVHAWQFDSHARQLNVVDGLLG